MLDLAPSSVSMALNDRKGISPDVRIKVKEAAKKYGYLPYIKSRETGMYNKNSRVISIIYPRCDIHITESVQLGIDKLIRENDYHKIRYTVDLYNELASKEAKDMFIASILEHTSTNGILLFSIELSETTVVKLAREGIYTVFLNTFLDYGKCVYIDNMNAARKATEKLIKAGRREVALVIPDAGMGMEWKDRFEGYKKALQENKIEFNPDYIMYENDFSSLKKIAYATRHLVEANPKINGILYASDILAFGGIKILKDMGKKVPDDIAIIGIDDMPIDAILKPSLSSVRLPLEKMGELGAKMLLDTIDKGSYKSESIFINESRLILRESFRKENKGDSWI